MNIEAAQTKHTGTNGLRSYPGQSLYESHALLPFLLGCICGLVFFLLIYGGAIVNPTYTDWLLHSDDLEGSVDLTQHYMGWVFYRNTPWQFPFGLTEGIYSSPVSVIYTDSIPLFAFIFKCLSPLLPTDFQYFGIYGLMCCCLMGGFAVLLVRRASDSPVLHIMAAVIFISNPVMLNRMYLHTALAGHFIIVAGLCLYLYHDRLSFGRRLLLWTILVACGTLINAYFAPMLYGLLFFAVISGILSGELTGKRSQAAAKAAATLFLPAIVTGTLCYCFGMFYGNVPSSAGGLEVLSFNLNGFFNPLTKLTAFHDHDMGYTDMIYSRWLPALPMMTAYQNEGFSYLGAGVIVLLLTAILFAVSKPLRPAAPDEAHLLSRSGRGCLLFLMLIFLALALSPAATLGNKLIYSLVLPDFIHGLWSSFRSTARFIWPLYYCILAMPFLYLGERLSDVRHNPDSRRSLIIRAAIYIVMAIATIIQVLDLTPGYAEKHAAFSSITPYESTLSDPMWDDLGSHAENIVFYPPTEYGLYEDGKTSVEFEIYAQKYGLSLNNTYMSRNLCDPADRDTMEHFRSRADGASYPHTIYIFFDNISEADLPDAAIYRLHYYRLGKYTVGVEEP